MYITTVKTRYGTESHSQILNLWRELGNAREQIRHLADLMIEQNGMVEDEFESDKDHICVVDTKMEIHYSVVEMEVEEDSEC